jgi:hypothetical protein
MFVSGCEYDDEPCIKPFDGSSAVCDDAAFAKEIEE